MYRIDRPQDRFDNSKEHIEFSLNVISSDGWQTNETFPYITGDVFLSVENQCEERISLEEEALTEDLQGAIIETVSMASDLDCFESTLITFCFSYMTMEGCYGRLLTIP
jgi:hypothetical protein